MESQQQRALFMALESDAKLRDREGFREEAILSFGTSGLRAKMGPGLGHMNNCVVKLAATVFASIY